MNQSFLATRASGPLIWSIGMCGRFALAASISKIKEQFDLSDLPEVLPRYNISPGQEILFLCQLDDSKELKPLWLRWGLIPFWAKDIKIGNRLANARSETVAEKPAFRQSFKSRRGIFIMSGFYEWHQGSYKQPYYIKAKNDKLLAVAGLWDSWQAPEGGVIRSCCLLTTSANQMMSEIHDRMPVILSAEEMNAWLDNASFDKSKLLGCLHPYVDEQALMSYPVTTKMNNARFESVKAIEPISSLTE